MPNPCSICSNPQREEIERALEAGQTYRLIAHKFAVTRSSIARHAANHCPCKICCNPKREEIEFAIEVGQEYRAIANHLGISPIGIERHVRKHAPHLARPFDPFYGENLDTASAASRVPIAQDRVKPSPEQLQRLSLLDGEVQPLIFQGSPSQNPHQVIPQPSSEVQRSVGLFVTAKECIGNNQVHYERGNLEIWPLDMELGPYWQRVETTIPLDPYMAEHGSLRRPRIRYY